MADKDQLRMTFTQMRADKDHVDEKVLIIGSGWEDLARQAAMHQGTLFLKAEVPEWLRWLGFESDKPPYFTNGNLVSQGWEQEQVCPYFFKETDTMYLHTQDGKYRVKTRPGHAMISPFDSMEEPLFVEFDMPWWYSCNTPSVDTEIKEVLKTIYQASKDMCKEEGVDKNTLPFFTPLKLSVQLQGPVLVVEAWVYYGTICKMTQENSIDE